VLRNVLLSLAPVIGASLSLIPACAAEAANAQDHAASTASASASSFTEPDFHFSDGTTLPDIHIHYVTLGEPHRDSQGTVTNAVLLLHGTTGTAQAFLTPVMRRELFAPNEPLDTRRYFIIIPDGLGRGGSSKPSDGLRTKFPHYGYGDVVEANHRLLVEGLHVTHLRLVLGTSMGGMQTWMWGERYPDMADALMPISSQPVAMSGRNWLWRQIIIGAIRSDPGWDGGNYAVSPTLWARTMPIFTLITGNAVQLQKAAPDRDAATRLYESLVAQADKLDANDTLYWFESSWDYDPAPGLSRIRAHLLAVNFADDLINASDPGMELPQPPIAHGQLVLMPATPQSYGHQTLAHPEVWKRYLAELLDSSARTSGG
jgi:homoserine O-acetyltransferase